MMEELDRITPEELDKVWKHLRKYDKEHPKIEDVLTSALEDSDLHTAL